MVDIFSGGRYENYVTTAGKITLFGRKTQWKAETGFPKLSTKKIHPNKIKCR